MRGPNLTAAGASFENFAFARLPQRPHLHSCDRHSMIVLILTGISTTSRISIQALANWLRHGLVGDDRMMAAMMKMAVMVNRQNADDPAYALMALEFDGTAFNAACDLAFKGAEQLPATPNRCCIAADWSSRWDRARGSRRHDVQLATPLNDARTGDRAFPLAKGYASRASLLRANARDATCPVRNFA